MRSRRQPPSGSPIFRAWLCLALLGAALGADLSHRHALSLEPPKAERLRVHACGPQDAHRWSPRDGAALRAPSNPPCMACRYRSGPLQPAVVALLRPVPPGATPLPFPLSPRPGSYSALGFLDRAPPA